jgi:hypothetical protein
MKLHFVVERCLHESTHASKRSSFRSNDRSSVFCSMQRDAMIFVMFLSMQADRSPFPPLCSTASYHTLSNAHVQHPGRPLEVQGITNSQSPCFWSHRVDPCLSAAVRGNHCSFCAPPTIFLNSYSRVKFVLRLFRSWTRSRELASTASLGVISPSVWTLSSKLANRG